MNHAPIIEGVIFNSLEDKLHSLFETLVGFSFTFYTISSAFIEKTVKPRTIDLAIG